LTQIGVYTRGIISYLYLFGEITWKSHIIQGKFLRLCPCTFS